MMILIVVWMDVDLWGVCGGLRAANIRHVGSLGNLKFNMLHGTMNFGLPFILDIWQSHRAELSSSRKKEVAGAAIAG